MGTIFQCNDFLDRMGGQALVMIGRWYSRQPLTNHNWWTSVTYDWLMVALNTIDQS